MLVEGETGPGDFDTYNYLFNMWPEKQDIICENFSRELYPAIRDAIIKGYVNWCEGTADIRGNTVRANFLWEGCVWEIEEVNDTVNKFTLVTGKLSPKLTMLALIG